VGPALPSRKDETLRRITDERVAHLLMVDPREAKQPNYMQDSVNGLRQLVRDLIEQNTILRDEKPLHTSDVWLEVGSADERYVGAGHRASVRVPIGDERWEDGRPKRYVDVRAGRPQRVRRGLAVADLTPEPVDHVEIRTSGRCIIIPDFSNGVRVETDVR